MKPAQHSVLTAVFAIIALGLLVATASTCRFVRVLIGDASSFFGVYCTNGYDDEHDTMWIMARVMLSFALILDTGSTGIAVAIAWLTRPTKNRWQAISMMAAISAVFKVPVFLAFQAEPCSDVDCEFSLGGYFLLFSITFSIAMTILTQCLEPPRNPRNVIVPSKRGNQENLNQNNEDRLSINRTMTEDEEERLMMGGTRPQEAKVGDTASQTILLGETESHDMVIRNVMTRDTEISALTENAKEVESASLHQAAANSASESRSAVRTGLGDGSVSECTYSQDLLRVEEVRYTVARLPKENSPSPPPPPPSPPLLLDASNNQVRTPTEMVEDSLLEEPSELQSTPSDPKVKPSSSDDLGSLAPTITGDDSLLDQSRDTTSDESAKKTEKNTTSDDFKIISAEQTQKITREEPKTSKNISDTVQKVIASPFDIGKALVTRAKQKRRIPYRLKCYRLMDDDDMESTYPISPPLEILTVKLSADSDQGNRPPTEHEKALIEQWNALHGNGTTPHSTDVEDPDLYLSSDEESRDDLPPETRSIGETEESPSKSITAGRSSQIRMNKRNKKSRSRRLVYSGLSVASGPSLLSMENVIEEETAADLEESSASEQGSIERFDPYGAPLTPVPLTRTRSAPNLAGFARQKSERGYVHEDLKLTGMNSFHSAEIFRVRGRSTQSLSGKRNRPLLSLSPQAPRTPIRDTRSLPPAKKTPLFRQERALTGIHRAAGNLSDHSSSDDNLSRSIRSTGVLSRRARLARIRRLQMFSHPIGSMSSAGRTPPKANRIPEYATPPRYGIAQPAIEFHTPPVSGGTQRSARSAGTISSGNISSASDCYSIDMLDVQLAELSRPDDGSKGPDEESF